VGIFWKGKNWCSKLVLVSYMFRTFLSPIRNCQESLDTGSKLKGWQWYDWSYVFVYFGVLGFRVWGSPT
jgi:hypothetical protein